MTIKRLLDVSGHSLMINERYQMYSDGTIYDTKQAKDIPQWIFDFRDFVLKNSKRMKLVYK